MRMKTSTVKLNSFTFFKLSSTVFAFLFFLSFVVERPLLTVTGICAENSKPVQGVTVAIMVDGGVLTQCETAADGVYKLKVNFGKLVKLTFDKKGYLSQSVKLRTVLLGQSEKEMTANYNFEMISLPSDTSSIRFDRAVDEVMYDDVSNKFVSNMEYQERVKADFEAVKSKIFEAKATK